MKLAEALALRGDAQKRFEQLRTRAQSNARYQEGEPPPEDAGELLAEADRVLVELEDLIRRINRTNAGTTIEAGVTLTDALARRDVLRLRQSLYSGLADAATGRTGSGARQLRSELRYLSALSVTDLRTTADGVAQEHRELDMKIQQANWEADLAD